jgi:hypothetical protein
MDGEGTLEKPDENGEDNREACENDGERNRQREQKAKEMGVRVRDPATATRPQQHSIYLLGPARESRKVSLVTPAEGKNLQFRNQSR